MPEMISIRASSLSELFDCPARWEAKYVRNMRMPASDAARLGTAVHAGTALFDQSRLDGNPLTADEAAGAVVDAIHHPDEDVDWGESSPREPAQAQLPSYGDANEPFECSLDKGRMVTEADCEACARRSKCPEWGGGEQ